MRFEACAVYILSNLNRSILYTGVTGDLVRRVAEHREHVDPRSFTSRYRVDRLVHFEPYQDIVAAIEREKQVKGVDAGEEDRAHREDEPRLAGPLAGDRGVTS